MLEIATLARRNATACRHVAEFILSEANVLPAMTGQFIYYNPFSSISAKFIVFYF
jgi:hypothetical protein